MFCLLFFFNLFPLPLFYRVSLFDLAAWIGEPPEGVMEGLLVHSHISFRFKNPILNVTVLERLCFSSEGLNRMSMEHDILELLSISLEGKMVYKLMKLIIVSIIREGRNKFL